MRVDRRTEPSICIAWTPKHEHHWIEQLVPNQCSHPYRLFDMRQWKTVTKAAEDCIDVWYVDEGN
jgi:hypothetical protein